jgi:hypothetical protein
MNPSIVSQNLFNLLVKFSPWADSRDTIPIGRALEYTDDALVERFEPGGQLDLAALTALPTLFVQETSGRRDQVARVGTITRARMSEPNIILEYAYDAGIPSLPNETLEKLAADLDVKASQFYRTHWSVKDVDLYRFFLRNAQPRRTRPAVFQISEHENIEPSLVSAMMPFDPSFNAVYAALQRTAESAGLRCRRADDIWENPAVIQDVVSLIDRSHVIICDCTGRNPNVFYEIGIAHTLGREVILITQAAADIPFDLRHLRFVLYLNNGEGLNVLSACLERRLSDLTK